MEKRHIGIDLHRNRFTCCIRLENGRTYVTEWVLEDLARFAKKLRPSDEVAVEITSNARLFYDAVAPHVARVVVVDTNQFRVISQSVKKTDANDARLLSLYLSKGLLTEVRMKDKALAQLASLTQTRDRLVKQRSALKNKVNNILSARGLNLAKEALSSEKKLTEVLELPFDEVVRIELRVIVEQIRSLNKSVAELEKAIGEEGSKLEGGHYLPNAEKQVGVRELSQFCVGGGSMKTLGNPPPGIQASGSHYAVRYRFGSSRTLLGRKGSLRRGPNRRALAPCAPFCIQITRDGRLRREPDAAQFLRLTKDENQVVIDKTS
jgi:hypothetical protein